MQLRPPANHCRWLTSDGCRRQPRSRVYLGIRHRWRRTTLCRPSGLRWWSCRFRRSCRFPVGLPQLRSGRIQNAPEWRSAPLSGRGTGEARFLVVPLSAALPREREVLMQVVSRCSPPVSVACDFIEQDLLDPGHLTVVSFQAFFLQLFQSLTLL